MQNNPLLQGLLGNLPGKKIHFTGIKGTGMAAMAELFLSHDAIIAGSDVSEKFYTDEVLQKLGISYNESFSKDHVAPDTDLLIHSAAYDPSRHEEIVQAKKMGIPVLVYTEALGLLSEGIIAGAVSGVHGKTTTTAMAACIVDAARIPASVLVGSAVPAIGGGSTLVHGDSLFIAETCEYRRHFLSFHPEVLLVTNIELDHPDYFKDEADMFSAFEEFSANLPSGGVLIYCADDPGSRNLGELMKSKRPDVETAAYGFHALGSYALGNYELKPGRQCFTMEAFGELEILLPGMHNVLNAAGAASLVDQIQKRSGGAENFSHAVARGLRNFTGTKRRAEIVGEASGILILDDYAHHPSAVRTTLSGFRDFYPGRRIILSFMAHTYTRTEKLLDDFLGCFDSADILLLHKIYASAREKQGSIDSEIFYNLVREHREDSGLETYFEAEPDDALELLSEMVKPGDVVITMGAGSNWTLGKLLLTSLKDSQ
jgi:UDP-N-acetylmuramate--alanine ligase